jgi:eukaryotic-like serine/threonine-protein kinase
VESLLTLANTTRTPNPQGPAPPPAVNDLVLGRYRLLECLGAGGFGVVWRARDELLHREVAVKRVALAPDGDSERASREALASARLAHPAIVALYEACAVEDAFYLISELVHGRTLAQLIAARELCDEDVLEIGVALACALSHAHARGVIHRDIKPQNVLVPDQLGERVRMPEGFICAAKLTDFGGASLAGEDVLTHTGDVLGTLAYMAPEQSEGRDAGAEADLYALALVLYEALSGVNPVRGATPAATARRIGHPLAPLERRRRDLPRALTRALDTGLLPSPKQRGTLEDLRLALEQALEQGPRSARLTLWPRRAGGQDAIAGPPPAARDEQPSEFIARRRILDRGRAAAEPPPLAEAVHPDEASQTRRRARTLPRKLLPAGVLAAILWQLSAGRSGAALLVLCAALPLALWPRDRSSRGVGFGWLAAALAPLLGLAGLAGAFPAIAGQASSLRNRAAIAALGYWWLILAEALFARNLWLGEPPGLPARSAWEASLSSTATHVVAPALSLGVLLGAVLWAVGAAILPFVVRGRRAAFDVVGVTVWSAAMASATPLLGSGLSVHAAHLSQRGAVLGAVLGGALAVGVRALRGPV